MYPRTLIGSELKSKGEERMFDALRDGLNDSWEAFHSVGWITRDHATGTDDGEIDFVLAKVGEPIVCLEVKGGGLECRHGEWYRLKERGPERFRDPFAQAVDHTYALERALAQFDAWGKRKIHIVEALAFPDISIHKLVLGLDAHPELVIDKNDLSELPAAITRILAFHRGSRDKRDVLDAGGLESLRDLLAPEVRIEVPMATSFLDEEAEMITLTHQQANLLNRFARDRRLAVHGCAGSGKTMLAVEQAKRLAAKGQKVLFVCFNTRLKDHLREREKASGIDFWNFHALCRRLAGKAEVELSAYPKGEAPPEYFSDELPLALIEAIEKLGPHYDAIFVDEAQDLENTWLEALLTMLNDHDKGQVWLFLDDNQRVYEAQLDVPDEFRPFDLTVNCRNTQEIAREVHKKYKGEIEPEISGPVGREIELLIVDDPIETVQQKVVHLIETEEVPPQDIVVLSAHNRERSEVGQAGLPGKYFYVDKPELLGPYVRFSSIRGFKGLEAPVVILCELEDLDEETRDQQLYVGMSRAKNHCVVVVPTPHP